MGAQDPLALAKRLQEITPERALPRTRQMATSAIVAALTCIAQAPPTTDLTRLLEAPAR